MSRPEVFIPAWYAFCALMCAFLLSAFAENRKQARVALLVSAVWPIAAVALTGVCLCIIGEALFGVVAKAFRGDDGVSR